MVRHNYGDFINEEGSTKAPLFLFQSSSVKGSEIDTPESDRFAANNDTSFSEQIFNKWSGTPAVAEIETIVKPDRVTDDIGWESVAFASIHPPILPISGD